MRSHVGFLNVGRPHARLGEHIISGLKEALSPWISPLRRSSTAHRNGPACDLAWTRQTAFLPTTIKDGSAGDDQLPLLLIAEDNADDLFFLRRLLAKANVRNPIKAFADGAKAIEFLQSLVNGGEAPTALPCIVFLDVRMPLVQGFEVLSFARKLRVFDDLKIVMLSSSDHPADKQRAIDLGANGYFVKHPTAEALGTIVRGT